MVVEMPEMTRRQLLLWAVVGVVMVLVGGRYLLARDDGGDGSLNAVTAATVELKQQEETAIKVHVVGAVVSPGLYDLEAGCRTAEAIEAAGGPSPAADLSRVNLAAKVADGQQLVVPEAGAAPAAAGGATAGDGPVNLNSAGIEELTSLDGIGPKTAQKIIDYREEHGGFGHIEELMDVPGIGPGKFGQIKDKVTV